MLNSVTSFATREMSRKSIARTKSTAKSHFEIVKIIVRTKDHSFAIVQSSMYDSF